MVADEQQSKMGGLPTAIHVNWITRQLKFDAVGSFLARVAYITLITKGDIMEYLIIVILLVIFYIIYARVIAMKNRVREAASSIQVQLQKRRNLIPNVLTLAKKFMEHEKDLLAELTALRVRAVQTPSGTDPETMKADLSLDSSIGGGLGNFFVVAENYPELKSQSTIVRAQESYEEVEGHIAAARRFYNSAVTDLNNMRETFPMSVIAAMVGVQEMPYFEATKDAYEPVNAADHL